MIGRWRGLPNAVPCHGYRNRNTAAAALYQELADALGIEVMANQFGHSEKTAQKHYTDASDLSGLASAAGLRAV